MRSDSDTSTAGSRNAYRSTVPMGVDLPFADLPQKETDAEMLKGSTASDFNESGTVYFKANDFGRALHAFNHAIELCAEFPEAYNNRGFTRETMGDHAGALEDYSVATRLDPDHAEADTNRGALRHAIGDGDAALEDYDRALSLTPAANAASVYLGRGGVFLTRLDFDAAIADLDRAIRLDPRLWPAYVTRANARYHKSDPGAIDDYWMAMQIEPELAAREIVRKILGDIDLSVRAVLVNCKRHLRANLNDPLSRARRGLTLLLLDQHEEAAKDLALFLHHAPSCESHIRRLVAEVGRQRSRTRAATAQPLTVMC